MSNVHFFDSPEMPFFGARADFFSCSIQVANNEVGKAIRHMQSDNAASRKTDVFALKRLMTLLRSSKLSAAFGHPVNPPALQKGYRLSFRTMVVGIVLFSSIVTATAAIGFQYYFSRAMAIDNALVQYQIAAQNNSEYVDSIDDQATGIARLLAAYPFPDQHMPGSSATLELFAEVMRSNNMLYSIYLGFSDGGFYEVVNLNNSTGVRQTIKATETDRWVVNYVFLADGKRMRQLNYYDEKFLLRDTRIESSNYDSRNRPWFKNASADKVNKTLPYLFQYLQIPGQTYSIRLPDSSAVLGVDITLQSFSEHLQQQRINADVDMFVYRQSGEILASSVIESVDLLPEVKPLELNRSQRDYLSSLGKVKITNEMDWFPIDFSVAGQPKGYSIDIINMIAASLGLDIEFINGYSWPELENKFASGDVQIIHPVTRYSRLVDAGRMTDAILHLPYALAVKTDIEGLTDPGQLSNAVLAIPAGWGWKRILMESFPDINILEVDSTREALEAVQTGKAHATLDSAAILRYTRNQYFMDDIKVVDVELSNVGLPAEYHLLIKPELNALFDLINLAIKQITPEQIDFLENKWLDANGAIRSNSLSIVPYKNLIEKTDVSGAFNKLREFTVNNEQYFAYVTPLDPENELSDYFAVVVSANKIFQESMERVYISVAMTLGCLLFLLPFGWLISNPIVRPVRDLFEKSVAVKERKYNEVDYKPTSIAEVDDLSLAMVGMAEAIQKYQNEQRELMEAFIRLIAGAIDKKSPYTGGHCERVPELAIMLADAASVSNKSAFADFCFKTDDEYREFEIAAWLHDCGKITVPEHVVDKGTKLEAIYNRIHEVRMRFEVLWRDAEIACLNATIDDPENSDKLKKVLLQQQEKILDDFAFVAKSNVGGEFFGEEEKQRLQVIGKTTWLRHFDDRLGLSPVEELRFSKKSQQLPVQEYLLSDKPEHIIPRQHQEKYDAKYCIKMSAPEHLYNMGELYNLSIARGTLTAEDRFKINEHVVSTIQMLEGLPFPDELARVPRYASTHHETMNGTGYPRKLNGTELSIPERILVVADIFEALTAADRPYKKAKSLSVSINILYEMVLEKHIDKDVFELFLSSGVYLTYAEKFLAPEQIDDVDIGKYLVADD